jgi:hypothetical protein
MVLRSIVLDHMVNTDAEFGAYLRYFMKEHPDSPLPFTGDLQGPDGS